MEIYGNPQATQKMLDDAFFNVEAWINSELATELPNIMHPVAKLSTALAAALMLSGCMPG